MIPMYLLPIGLINETPFKMKIFFPFFTFLFFLFSTISAQEINVAQLKKHVKFLASDKLKGRGTGTQDELTAANYIRTNFSDLKLEPKGNSNSYYYSYTFKKPKD